MAVLLCGCPRGEAEECLSWLGLSYTIPDKIAKLQTKLEGGIDELSMQGS